MRLEPPSPLEYFAALVADDESLPLLESALAVAQDEYPQLDMLGVLAEVDSRVHRLRQRIPADAGDLQRLRMLNRVFFDELGFAGNVNDFDDPRNCYLSDVLERRRGMPVSLALLYLEFAAQIGLRAEAVPLAAHVLVRLHLSDGLALVDPFRGRLLSRTEAAEQIGLFARPRRGLAVARDVWMTDPSAATPRVLVERLLRHLREAHHRAGDLPRELAVIERLVVLQPGHARWRRERGLLRAEQGQTERAIEDLSYYLARRPDADDADVLRRRLQDWQAARSRPTS